MTIHEGEIMEPGSAIQPATSSALATTEIDLQISTAKNYPRKVETFLPRALALVKAHMAQTKNPSEGLVYSIPRGGKKIEGPNVRLSEIIVHTFGNCRIGARPIAEDENFVTSQGVFHDLEANIAITFEVRRRIRDSHGQRYNDDMITTTANAASAIAYRNAALKGIPKTIWWPLFEAAKKAQGGTDKELSGNVKIALEYCDKCKIPRAAVLSTLGVKSEKEIDTEKLSELRGILTAAKDGDTTLEVAFGLKGNGGARPASNVKEKPAKQKKEDDDKPITKDQAMTLATLMGDLNLAGPDMRKLCDKFGHAGKWADLPASKFAEMVEAMQKIAKK